MAKKSSPILSKPKGKPYTKGQFVAHLAATVSQTTGSEISKKQVLALLDAQRDIALTFAPVGGVIPGLGKLVLRTIPAKPARTVMSFGKEIQVAAKPKRKKLVFRFSKNAKESAINVK
jgi:hypothetical protein